MGKNTSLSPSFAGRTTELVEVCAQKKDGLGVVGNIQQQILRPVAIDRVLNLLSIASGFIPDGLSVGRQSDKQETTAKQVYLVHRVLVNKRG